MINKTCAFGNLINVVERQNLYFTDNEIRENYFQIESKQLGLIFLCSSKLMKLLFLSCSKIKFTSESANLSINSRTCWYLSGPGNVVPGGPWAFFAFLQHSGCYSLFQELIHPSSEASSDLCHYRILLPL